MSDWKIQVARILGEPTTTILKNYYGQSNSLEVNEERLLTFYDYLRDELTFPFTAFHGKAEVTCMGLDQEMNVDEIDGIKLVCKRVDEEVTIPLTKLIVEDTNANLSAIELYQKWVREC
ncbi:calcium-binding protein [Lentibacillus sp. Marseille-P4043]|uniref:calcium-binding protein n=1 Tax=Lentibacillus sp. Marseille-P4043 TaxID=2040293 RepID=UPI000D0B255B|nr:calcium-binding protein [Lentibacillus sp. Marseille-P4043]